jgi:hypothetical protein
MFYRVMRTQDRYRYANALVDGPSAVLAEIEDRIARTDPVWSKYSCGAAVVSE